MAGSKWGDFLTEKSMRGGFNRLRSWKEDGEVVVWIHTNTAIHKRLFHMIPYVGKKEDENTKKQRTSILYLPFVCHEDVNDYLRKGKNHIPCNCPICRFIQHLKDSPNIADGETVWDSSIGDRKRDRICTKADFIGDTDAGGDWRLAFKPAIEYVLAVIDNDNIEEGIRVATEKFSLGEKIKKAVQKEIDRRGPELGDPDQNPYAFKFIFDSKARQAADYYDAYPYERVKITSDIEDLLAEPEQDLTSWIDPGDTKTLREAMEAHVTVDDVDFDILFDNVKENSGTNAEQPEEATYEVQTEKKTGKSVEKAAEKKVASRKTTNTKAAKSVAQKTTTKSKKAPKPPPEPDPEPEEDTEEDAGEEGSEQVTMMTCPLCRGKGKKKNGKECRVCDGTGEVEAPDDDDYEEPEPAPEPEPKKEKPKATTPPKQRKTRKAAAPPPPPEPEPEPEEEEVAECARCNKDVPMSATACPHCGAQFE